MYIYTYAYVCTYTHMHMYICMYVCHSHAIRTSRFTISPLEVNKIIVSSKNEFRFFFVFLLGNQKICMNPKNLETVALIYIYRNVTLC